MVQKEFGKIAGKLTGVNPHVVERMVYIPYSSHIFLGHDKEK